MNLFGLIKDHSHGYVWNLSNIEKFSYKIAYVSICYANSIVWRRMGLKMVLVFLLLSTLPTLFHQSKYLFVIEWLGEYFYFSKHILNHFACFSRFSKGCLIFWTQIYKKCFFQTIYYKDRTIQISKLKTYTSIAKPVNYISPPLDILWKPMYQ